MFVERLTIMGHYALIGRRLGHSWSQRWFEERFAREGLTDCTYRLHETESLDGLRRWVEEERIDGFNVTIPYKQAILPLLDELSPEAEAIGAVNCVVVRDGRLTGHNTDAPAFASSEFGVRSTSSRGLPQSSELMDAPANSELRSPNSALILGTGGAARAVGYALKGLGIKYLYVSRNPQGTAIGYTEAAARRQEFDMLVNATPVGMWPAVNTTPWPYSLEGFRLVYDLIYNPSPTLLLRQAAAAGAATRDGLAMLHRQAELSWQLWRQQ